MTVLADISTPDPFAAVMGARRGVPEFRFEAGMRVRIDAHLRPAFDGAVGTFVRYDERDPDIVWVDIDGYMGINNYLLPEVALL